MSREPGSPAIQLIDISKYFGSVAANSSVSFDARFGEVHALVGENGAGKSTLMSMVAGLYRPDSGTIAISGEPVTFRSPRDAISRGVGMVYQHFMLVETMTVAENLLIGLPDQGVRLKLAEVTRAIVEISTRFGLDVDPDAYIWQLSVGEQQRVEILRLLYRGARILVFDEPTAVLTPVEANRLIETLRSMAAGGYCLIFISHKLDEVLAVSDRITVLRRGEAVGTVDAADTSRREIARMMVGRELNTDPAPVRSAAGAPVLTVSGLKSQSDRGIHVLNDVSFEVAAGEILGIAGVAGNGQRELAEVITGLRPSTAGQVLVGAESAIGRSVAEIAALGVAHIPEDRLATGLAGGIDVEANTVMRHYRGAPMSRGPLLRRREIGAFADKLIADHDVKTPSRRTRVRNLSGGNQQKLIIARELAGAPAVIVANSPTRGVDIGATEAIHEQLLAHRERGAAILLISEDLEELRALADRIAVMVRGQVVGIVPRAEATVERLGLLMSGAAERSDAATDPAA